MPWIGPYYFDPHKVPSAVEDKIYFRSRTGELMVYDGQTIEPASDLYRSFWGEQFGAFGSSEFVRIGNALYFSTNDTVSGRELWRMTGDTTELAADIWPGHMSSYPYDLTALDGDLYFFATKEGYERTLYRYRDSLATPLLIIEPHQEYESPSDLTVFRNELYFTTYRVEICCRGETEGTLWKFANGTITAINDPSVVSVRPNPIPHVGEMKGSQLTVFRDELFFVARQRETGYELWKYDGSNLSIVADLAPGPEDSIPYALTVFNDTLYFVSGEGGSRWALWKYDGNDMARIAGLGRSEGPVRIEIAAYHDAIYFAGPTGTAANMELWKHDDRGTALVADLLVDQTGDSSPHTIMAFRGELYFAASDGRVPGDEQFWKYHENGVTQVADVSPEDVPWDLYLLSVVNDRLYFGARKPGNVDSVLWAFNGMSAIPIVAEGTGAKVHVYAGPIEFEGQTYFVSGPDSHAPEVWTTDGITARPAPEQFWPVASNGVVTFYYRDEKIWRYDGTNHSDVSQVFPSGTQFKGAVFADGSWYYKAARPGGSSVYDVIVWRSDENGENAQPIGAELPPQEYRGPVDFTWFQGALYFRSFIGYQSPVVRKWDGNELAIVDPASLFSRAFPPVLSDGSTAYIGVGNGELWRYDGARYSRVAQFPIGYRYDEWGPMSSGPNSLTIANGGIFFSACTTKDGCELWTLTETVDGDLDGDGRVGLTDLAILRRHYGDSELVKYSDGDINADGAVTQVDLALLVRNFGYDASGGPRGAPAASPTTQIAAGSPRNGIRARVERENRAHVRDSIRLRAREDSATHGTIKLRAARRPMNSRAVDEVLTL